MNIYLIIINDHLCATRYLVFDNLKKANKYFQEMVDAYNEATFYDYKGRTHDECVKDLSWSNGRDSIKCLTLMMNSKKAVS